MTEDRAQAWTTGKLSEQEKDGIRSTLLNSMATEFFQPLNLISLNREYLQMHLERERENYSAQKVNEALDGIDCATVQLDRLMNNCLDLMNCLQGRAKPQKVAVDLPALLSDIVATGQVGARILGQQIVLETGKELCVETDRAMAERIFLNLLSNALHAGRPGGRISISLQKSPGNCVFSIKDEGSGVSPAFAAQAFETLRQNGRQDRFLGGAGLGLYLCSEFCRLLGWQPEMRALKQGTAVTIYIPAGQIASDRMLVFHSTPGQRQMQAEETYAHVLQELRCVPGLEKLEK
jgi:signal transduction histidine kinase